MTIELVLLPFEGVKGVQYSHSILRLCGFVQSVDVSIENIEFMESIEKIYSSVHFYEPNEISKQLHTKLKELTEKSINNKQYVPKDFTSHLCPDVDEETGFEECHYGETTIDPYGDPIVYVFVKDLLELEELHREYYKDEEQHINKEKALATMAYIKTLPKNRKIALYWC